MSRHYDSPTTWLCLPQIGSISFHCDLRSFSSQFGDSYLVSTLWQPNYFILSSTDRKYITPLWSQVIFKPVRWFLSCLNTVKAQLLYSILSSTDKKYIIPLWSQVIFNQLGDFYHVSTLWQPNYLIMSSTDRKYIIPLWSQVIFNQLGDFYHVSTLWQPNYLIMSSTDRKYIIPLWSQVIFKPVRWFLPCLDTMTAQLLDYVFHR